MDTSAQWFLGHFVPILSNIAYNYVSVSHTIVNSLFILKCIQCLCVLVQVCMCTSMLRNPLKINLHVWFHFNIFLESFKYKQQMVNNTILYNTCEAGHIESSVLLPLSASCLEIV